MISPWSTNAVEITQNMGIENIQRIESFTPLSKCNNYDKILLMEYDGLRQDIFDIPVKPNPIIEIENIESYNKQEGLALSESEILYLKDLSKALNRPLKDCEVFGFSQVNSEHCRHKIFNGRFIIDGKEKPKSLFQMIKETSKKHSENLVSAYKDNVAFIKGPVASQFAPSYTNQAGFYREHDFESVISLKAETHNFPTTVEPFNGAATGSGGEIRDRLAGGLGSLPLAGTAVYMTSYSRLKEDRSWEQIVQERAWKYQSPSEILIKASDGTSDFGNKFGQPLIVGSVFTFEHEENNSILGYDKVIMLAGGVGYAKQNQSQKYLPKKNQKVVVLGGDNYRIGMGGAAVSSTDTGSSDSSVELNAVQRSNPEMQKRVANTIRAMVERDHNPIQSIHDHGAGGHLNCLLELLEKTGGTINMDNLPVGDPSLSAKELIGNESQERMGLIIDAKNLDLLKAISDRERTPLYVVGKVTGDNYFKCHSKKKKEPPINLKIKDLLGDPPKMILEDTSRETNYKILSFDWENIYDSVAQLLKLESVGCKDWLTNKVDRCVSGRVAKQQCVGALQLPLNNVGVVAIDYKGEEGIATAIGHSPITGLIDPKKGSINSIAEALTNIIWAPINDGLKGVSLSANWMWPCNQKGENTRLYEAVKACSEFAIALKINIPTGKDSLSMTQKYPGFEVNAPGTLIVSATGHCSDIKKVVEPILQNNNQKIYYVGLSSDHFSLGGSAFAQICGRVGSETWSIKDHSLFSRTFDCIQNFIKKKTVYAGHDVSSGGLITTLLEMCFADSELGASVDLTSLGEEDTTKLLFSENASLVIQTDDNTYEELQKVGISIFEIGYVNKSGKLKVQNYGKNFEFEISHYRDLWFETSYLLDQKQSGVEKAKQRFENYKNQPLKYTFPKFFTGKLPPRPSNRPKAAVIREKGSNSEREMAYAMYLAGFDVKDIHMTDLVSGRETLEDIKFLGAVGGFSNSDVLGSAKGWAGTFRYNKKANKALSQFFAREDTLSLGICNGCQLFVELGIIYPELAKHPKMEHNLSRKFECIFTSVKILENNSVMLSGLSGNTLGIWSAHAEGRFSLVLEENKYNIVAKFGYNGFPANPNGSDYNTAMICSKDGRHLASMPHFERSIFPWNWSYYPTNREDEVSPWLQAFANAREWIENL
ncbi:phosphoribosylformylglycinamidine synthase [Elysia marginata]|uniref:Phosphoribosylformylglycinamidine synthase n=1 Tax=Elysia marginata TaxID=1093978 RepID=A0AAV4EKG5_9GAST|nr:phosphoribosylformylglycinamidine synthase [Elysia marginata]